MKILLLFSAFCNLWSVALCEHLMQKVLSGFLLQSSEVPSCTTLTEFCQTKQLSLGQSSLNPPPSVKLNISWTFSSKTNPDSKHSLSGKGQFLDVIQKDTCSSQTEQGIIGHITYNCGYVVAYYIFVGDEELPVGYEVVLPNSTKEILSMKTNSYYNSTKKLYYNVSANSFSIVNDNAKEGFQPLSPSFLPTPRPTSGATIEKSILLPLLVSGLVRLLLQYY